MDCHENQRFSRNDSNLEVNLQVTHHHGGKCIRLLGEIDILRMGGEKYIWFVDKATGLAFHRV